MLTELKHQHIESPLPVHVAWPTELRDDRLQLYKAKGLVGVPFNTQLQWSSSCLKRVCYASGCRAPWFKSASTKCRALQFTLGRMGCTAPDEDATTWSMLHLPRRKPAVVANGCSNKLAGDGETLNFVCGCESMQGESRSGTGSQPCLSVGQNPSTVIQTNLRVQLENVNVLISFIC